MSVLTLVWATGAGACLALGAVHFVIWLRWKRQSSYLFFVMAATSAAATAILEQALLHATNVDTIRVAGRSMNFAIAVLIISLTWFIALHLGTGRRILAWTITGLWVFASAVNLFAAHDLTFTEITYIEQGTLPWGEPFSVYGGTINPWKYVADVASLLFAIFVADASIRLYRRGNRRRALVVGGSVILFILIAGVHTPLIDAGVIESPTLISLSFLVIVLAMGLEVGAAVVRASQLSRELTHSERRWRTLLQDVELAIVAFDLAGRMEYVNPYYERLTGFSKEEVLGRPIRDLLAPSDGVVFDELFSRIATEGPRPHSEWTLRCASGKEARLAWSSVRLSDSEGRFNGVLSVGEDITDRFLVEQALADEKERMDIILSALETGLAVMDRDLNVVWVNQKLRSLMPYGDPAGMKCYQFCEQGDEPCEGCGALMVFEDGQVHETLRQNDLDKRWYQIVSQPIRNQEGEVVQVLESSTDVTERVESKQKLQSALEEVTALRDQLEAENISLRQELMAGNRFEQMIGESKALKYVWHRISDVAATETSVLVEGETGVGKELVVRAIHERSPRRDRPLIKVNCAALPAGLIESELFGHEKGAFTGAARQRRGHIELADGGTLFLDEIGELPLDVQAKLLGVLEDASVSPIGSERRVQVDVRFVAATNRCLEEEVRAGRFRRDLYYRLNVYPITVPPLRDRPEDIPLLVHHFVLHFAHRLDKTIAVIPSHVMKRLCEHSWPGNVRELRNVIERAVIASPDATLNLPEQFPTPVGADGQQPEDDKGLAHTLDDVQRRHIARVLEMTNGKIEGPEGAAAILDIKPSTLRHRIRKLGIERESARPEKTVDA